MNKFLLRIVLFMGIVTSVFVLAYCCLNFKNIMAVSEVLGCEVLSTCNSHEQCGIDPAIFTKYGNLNSIASQPWIWEAKLRLLLSTGRCHPKYLIIDRGCHEVLWGYSDDDVAQLVARFLPLQLIYKTCPYEVNWERALNYVIGRRSFDTVWAAKPPPGRQPGSLLDVKGRVAEHFGNVINGGGLPSQQAIDAFTLSLQRLVELAIQNGIVPILLSTPKHSQYLAAEPDAVRVLNRQITQELVDKCHIRYLDYSTMQLDDDCYADADHLGSKGRRLFTYRLMEDLGYKVQ